jgi:WD40 repeat protein
MHYMPDSETLVILSTGGENGAGFISFWDMNTYTETARFPAVSPWTAFALSGDGTLLAYDDRFATVHLWDIEGKAEIAAMTPSNALDTWVDGLSFNPDGTLIAAAYNNSDVRIWHVESGMQRLHLTDHPDIADEIAFSPNGTLLVSRGWNDGVRIRGIGVEMTIVPTITPTPRPTLTFTPVPQLAINGMATVTTTGGDALNVRSSAGRNFDIVTRLTDGTVVTLLEGPQEVDGLTW